MDLIQEDETLVIEFPDRDEIDLSDLSLQRELILMGVATGIPGGEMIFTKSVRLVAGGAA